MREIPGITVLECDQCHNEWKVDMTVRPYAVEAPPRVFVKPRDVDYYRSSGVYEAANVPYAVEQVSPGDFPLENACFAVCRSFSDRVCSSLRRGRPVLIPSGYCLYAPAIAGGMQRALGADKRIGVVWIDAHSDNRIAEEATGPMRFVSLPVSALAGQTYGEWRKDVCGLAEPVAGEHILMADARMRDEVCSRNLADAGITCLSSGEFGDASSWRNAVEKLAEEVDAIYLSVDADILEGEFIPGYIKTVPGGHSLETVGRNVRTVMETGKVLAFSAFCFDFDCYESGGDITYRSGAALIREALCGWGKRK